ncbi:hypothetical protein A2U01_0078327, partial [Trifolium medium]|nr:hypothetical protein [Trifolium medium]
PEAELPVQVVAEVELSAVHLHQHICFRFNLRFFFYIPPWPY